MNRLKISEGWINHKIMRNTLIITTVWKIKLGYVINPKAKTSLRINLDTKRRKNLSKLD